MSYGALRIAVIHCEPQTGRQRENSMLHEAPTFSDSSLVSQLKNSSAPVRVASLNALGCFLAIGSGAS